MLVCNCLRESSVRFFPSRSRVNFSAHGSIQISTRVFDLRWCLCVFGFRNYRSCMSGLSYRTCTFGSATASCASRRWDFSALHAESSFVSYDMSTIFSSQNSFILSCASLDLHASFRGVFRHPRAFARCSCLDIYDNMCVSGRVVSRLHACVSSALFTRLRRGGWV